MGDDHTAESSTVAHQSEFAFVDVMMPDPEPGRRAGDPRLRPARLRACRASPASGSAFKCVKDNIESTASVDGSLDRVKIVIPDDFAMPPGGLNIRPRADFLEQEARLHDYKRDAMLAFVRANKLNRIVTLRRPQPEDRHHHGRQVLSRRARRRWTSSASTRCRPTTWASACSRSPALAARPRASWSTSRAGSTSSSWSRRSAR